MPCYDPPHDVHERSLRLYECEENYRKAKISLMKNEAALCAVFTYLENQKLLDNVLSKCDWNKAGVSEEYVQSWWSKHKKRDLYKKQSKSGKIR